MEKILANFKNKSFSMYCMYKGQGIYRRTFHKYSELPPNIKKGVDATFIEVQKLCRMVYNYDAQYIMYKMKKVGINRKAFFKYCNILDSKYRNNALNNNDMYLMKYGFYRYMNDYLDYINT